MVFRASDHRGVMVDFLIEPDSVCREERCSAPDRDILKECVVMLFGKSSLKGWNATFHYGKYTIHEVCLCRKFVSSCVCYAFVTARA